MEAAADRATRAFDSKATLRVALESLGHPLGRPGSRVSTSFWRFRHGPAQLMSNRSNSEGAVALISKAVVSLTATPSPALAIRFPSSIDPRAT